MIRKPRPLIASRPVPPREPSRLTSSVIRPAFAAIPPATCTDDAASAAFRASARICPAGLAASPLAVPAELPDEPLEELPPHAAASATRADHRELWASRWHLPTSPSACPGMGNCMHVLL